METSRENVSLSSFFRDQFEIVHVAQVAFKNHPTTLLTWYGNNGNDVYDNKYDTLPRADKCVNIICGEAFADIVQTADTDIV